MKNRKLWRGPYSRWLFFIILCFAGMPIHTSELFRREGCETTGIDFANKETQLDLLADEHIRTIAHGALEKIKKIYTQTLAKLDLYNAGDTAYKEAILVDLKMICNNVIPDPNVLGVMNQADRATLVALFASIRTTCDRIKTILTTENNCDSPSAQSIEVRNKKLLQLMLQEQQFLSSSSLFSNFLKRLKETVHSNNPQPTGVYFLYAWPTPEREKEEKWVQPFLVSLQKHLMEGGVDSAKIDIVSNRIGSSIYVYMEQAKTDDYVLVFGTSSLKDKHDQGNSNVCVELINIIRKRERDLARGLRRVFPILLNGTVQTTFPPEYERYSTIRDWRPKGYLSNFQNVYLELFGLTPQHFLNVLQELWTQALVECPSEAARFARIVKERDGIFAEPTP